MKSLTKYIPLVLILTFNPNLSFAKVAGHIMNQEKSKELFELLSEIPSRAMTKNVNPQITYQKNVQLKCEHDHLRVVCSIQDLLSAKTPTLNLEGVVYSTGNKAKAVRIFKLIPSDFSHGGYVVFLGVKVNCRSKLTFDGFNVLDVSYSCEVSQKSA